MSNNIESDIHLFADVCILYSGLGLGLGLTLYCTIHSFADHMVYHNSTFRDRHAATERQMTPPPLHCQLAPTHATVLSSREL